MKEFVLVASWAINQVRGTLTRLNVKSKSAVSRKEDLRLVLIASIILVKFWMSFGARKDGNINSIGNNSNLSEKMVMKSF